MPQPTTRRMARLSARTPRREVRVPEGVEPTTTWTGVLHRANKVAQIVGLSEEWPATVNRATRLGPETTGRRVEHTRSAQASTSGNLRRHHRAAMLAAPETQLMTS